MIPPRHSRNQFLRERGSILVICMVLAALGTLGVAAFVSLLDARGHQVEAGFESMKRRATLQSGKALARDALYSNYLHNGNGLTSDQTFTIPGNGSFAETGVHYDNENVASVTLRAYASVPLSNSTALRTTKNGAVPLISYTTDVVATASDNVATDDVALQLRSYNPILGGELLSMHPSADFDSTSPLVSGNIRVNGRAMFWDTLASDLGSGIRADEFLLPNDIDGTANLRNVANNAVLPLNYPIPKQTTGFASSTPSYYGELDIVDSGSNDHNDYATRWASTTAGLETVDGSTASVVGPGPTTNPDGSDDATIESEIAARTPSELMTILPGYYPLSSRVLRAVADKDATAFNADQLYTIFSNHYPIPDDALAYLTGTHSAKISPRATELHEFNRTAAWSDGNNKIEVYLDNTALPHLLIRAAHDVVLHGQQDATAASAAVSLDPRGIAIANTGTDSINTIEFRGQNRRRLVFSISTAQGATPPVNGYQANMSFSGPTAFPRWDMILELQNTGATINASTVNTAMIYGGIRGSRRINVSSGTLSLNRQTDTVGYEELLSRNAWVESYLSP